MNPRDKARRMTQQLCALDPRRLTEAQLARVCGGGETASTSTSGTPEAGDDTVGDSGGGFNNLKQLGLAAFSYSDTEPRVFF